MRRESMLELPCMPHATRSAQSRGHRPSKPKRSSPARRLNSAILRYSIPGMKALRVFLVILGLAGPFAARAAARVDWLLDPSSFKAHVARSADGREVILDNGLVRRVVRLASNAGTVSFENLMTGESIIRAVRPEARVVLDGVGYEIGGLGGQPVQGFLQPAWIETLKANLAAFQFAGLKTGQTQARFPWKKRRECDDPSPPAPVAPSAAAVVALALQQRPDLLAL